MKKIKVMKAVLLLCAVFAFSSCEENGEIQFIIKDDFDAVLLVKGAKDQTSFSLDSSVNISDLLANSSEFVYADVESVTLQLVDYSGESIDGTIEVLIDGNTTILNESVSLSETPTDPIIIPEEVSNIMDVISSETFPITVNTSSDEPIEDDDFSIKLTFVVKATVE
ncbi:hypothetical protein [Polaribacter sargassicola]|uniref:hypothetical protein n=1 Tax=Polaribacter sargassicola TaxID=2836891 RepID=UPI001F46F092|nr:hypothetical protein [Polaribacter sp. DS7-9]MCG1035853.1 hypothetical protein [Polaribacter sp. DS7-9]